MIKKSSTFVIGDIHGNHKGLKQVLERSGFDYDNDTLIQLGDIVDGFPDTYECVEELLSIINLILIKGNHDDWFMEFCNVGIHPDGWKQGGYETAKSYLKQIGKEDLVHRKFSGGYLTALTESDVPLLHKALFRSQHLYYKDDKNRLFVHGGFNRHKTLKENKADYSYIFYWDRDLFTSAMSFAASKNKKYKFKIKEEVSEVFIGHTATILWETTQPIVAGQIINLDTGGGSKNGKITIMDIDTKEIWQSDFGYELYPDETGRDF